MAFDPLYWSTGLVLNAEGADASTTFTDISPTPKTASILGGGTNNVQISTAQAKSGTASIKFDGTGDYLSYADHTDFNFGSGDFCVEFWFRSATATGAQYNLMQMALPTASANADFAWNIFHQTTGKIAVTPYVGSGAPTSTTGNVVAVANVWRHIAFTREGSLIRIWIDGVLDVSAAITGSLNAPGGATTLRIGQYTTASPLNPNGYIDGVRITKGSARYTGTSTFAPDSTLYEVAPAATATAALAAPSGTVTALTSGMVVLAPPMGVLATLAAARADLSAPMGRVDATGHDATGERAFAGVAPMGVLAASTGARVTAAAPMGTLLTSITVPVSVRAELVGPMGNVVTSGTVTVSVRADLRLTSAGAVVARAGGYAVIEGPMGALNAAAAVGILARFANSAPMGDLNALATAGIVVRAALVAPMLERSPSARATLVAPMGFVTAVGRAVIATTYEAYAVNLKPKARFREEVLNEVTRYTNYPFNQIVRHLGNYYGVASDGIYLLGGVTDITTPITWTFKTALEDEDTVEKKTVRAVRFSGRTAPGATVTLFSGESGSEAYNYVTPRDASPQNHREKLGRGVKGRYYAVGMTSDGVLELDGLEPEVDKLTRKL